MCGKSLLSKDKRRRTMPCEIRPIVADYPTERLFHKCQINKKKGGRGVAAESGRTAAAGDLKSRS